MESKMPRLNFNGVQAIGEQALRYKAPTVFGNILAVNTTFLEVSQTREIYKFKIDVFSGNTVTVYLDMAKFNTVRMKFPLDVVQRLLDLLKPNFLKMHYAMDEENKFLELIPVSSGKVGLTLRDGKKDAEILQKYFAYIDELECYAQILSRVNFSKSFDQLSVRRISTKEELNSALQQSASRLKLHFLNSFELDADDLILVESVGTKSCQIDMSDFEKIFPVVRQIIHLCPKLDRLEFECNTTFEITWSYIKKIGEQISRRHELFKKQTLELHQSSPSLGIVAKAFFWINPSSIVLPADWLDLIKACAGFDGLESTTNLYMDDTYHTKLTLNNGNGQVEMSFNIILRHKLSDKNEKME